MTNKYEASAMRGAKILLTEAELLIKKVAAEKGGRTPISFPDSSYYLPTILGMTGTAIEKISDLEPILQQARKMLKSNSKKSPGKAKRVVRSDPGLAALFASEAIEAVQLACATEPEPVIQSPQGAMKEDENDSRRYGPVDDLPLRPWGIQLLSGRMSGIALIIGCAKNNAVAMKIIQELRRRNILCFLSGNVNGRSIIAQLQEEGMKLGGETCVIPLGTDTTSTIHGLGFASRISMLFGGFKPGKSRQIQSFIKNRLSGFMLALGDLDEKKIAIAAGALHFGFPLMVDTVVSHITARSKAAAGQLISMPFDSLEGKDDIEKAVYLVEKCIEKRRMKIKLSKLDLPVNYGTAFDGEIVSDADLRLELGGPHSCCFELLQMARPDEVTDGKIEIVGRDFSNVEFRGSMDVGIVVKVSGRKMHSQLEPYLERQINDFFNAAEGIQANGQRDRTRIRISNAAASKGFSLESLGRILQVCLRENFSTIVDKVQVTVITEPKLHTEWLEYARRVYQVRDQHLAGLADNTVREFYACTLCQSFSTNHVCVISPERPGQCGAYDWSGCMAAYRINSSGSIRPIKLGKQINAWKGQWKGTNNAVKILSHGSVNEITLYSIMDKPMTTSCSSECMVMLIPEANGVMVVSRDDASKTPAGMTFSTLACITRSSPQNPGLMGVGKSFLASPKFISAEGGFKRVVWMSSVLKTTMADELKTACERAGDPDLLNKIADEKDVTSVQELVAWLHAQNHPVLEMEPVFEVKSGRIS